MSRFPVQPAARHVVGVTHRLSAILAADAVGYSLAMSQDEDGTASFLERAKSTFARQIQANGGMVVDMAGDSVLAVFATASGAVRAALTSQKALAKISDSATSSALLFRVGIHLGDISEKDDGTVYGNGVNVASRLQALAPPGGVLVSEVVYSAVSTSVAATFEDAGEHLLKNIPRPIRTYRTRSSSLQRSVGQPPLVPGAIELSSPPGPSLQSWPSRI